MGYSKRQFCTATFEEIGLAAYIFDLTPEQLESVMRRMDSMMAEWNGKGIRVGYPIPASPEDNDLDEPTTVPDSANEAIITNLAIRIAPSFGKQVSTDTKISAKSAYNVLLSRACLPNEMQLTVLPAGAGNKPLSSINSTFLVPPVDTIDAGADSSFSLD